MQKLQINTITELYPGFYYSLLDFPSKEILTKALNIQIEYVWIINYLISQTTNSISYLSNQNIKLLSFRGNVNIVMRTEEFLENLGSFMGSLHIVQANRTPPEFPDPKFE